MANAITQDENNDVKAFGFWVYLMTDCLLFATLFATYVILRGNTYGGPSGRDIFTMPTVLLETLFLLTSSFTCGLAIMLSKARARRAVLVLLGLTFVLGAAFLGIEIHEFSALVADGHSWQQSGFLTAFFTLVGTHGLHISVGLLWLGVMMWQIIKKGMSNNVIRRLTLFSMFWHFLDVIWIFIFTIVYLMGVA